MERRESPASKKPYFLSKLDSCFSNSHQAQNRIYLIGFVYYQRLFHPWSKNCHLQPGASLWLTPRRQTTQHLDSNLVCNRKWGNYYRRLHLCPVSPHQPRIWLQNFSFEPKKSHRRNIYRRQFNLQQRPFYKKKRNHEYTPNFFLPSLSPFRAIASPTKRYLPVEVAICSGCEAPIHLYVLDLQTKKLHYVGLPFRGDWQWLDVTTLRWHAMRVRDPTQKEIESGWDYPVYFEDLGYRTFTVPN